MCFCCHNHTIVPITNTSQHAGEQPATADAADYCIHAQTELRELLINLLN